MPEIPELEAIRGFLTPRVVGQRIDRVTVRIAVVLRTPADVVRESLPGDTISGVGRRGKWLLLHLVSQRTLAVNPMLAGRFQFVEPTAKLWAKTCLVLGLGDHDLRYVDDRVMGKLYLVPTDALAALPTWAEGGPDLLDPSLTESLWLERLRRYRGAIKNVLINAAFVQGIGNAYADEVLWEAGINPYTTRTSLNPDEQRRLFHAARRVMAWATPLVAERMADGDRLDYQERRDFLRVHRRGGQPCPRCATTISEVTAQQRITSFCRTCQPGGSGSLARALDEAGSHRQAGP